MDCQYYFGPDKLAFTVQKNGRVVTNSNLPFHGIISRGLLNYFIQHKLSSELWYQYAMHLTNSHFEINNKGFHTIKKYAEKAQVLSFGQSAYCVQQYVSAYCKNGGIKANQVELWQIKEGHISSVWKVTITSPEETELFCVNVARDNVASIKLQESSEKMKIIGDKYPKINLAKVYAIDVLKDKSLPTNVVIARNEWIPDSYEIHNRRNKNTGELEWLMVDRFLTNENSPALITSVLGRVFTSQLAQQIENEINYFLTQSMTCLITGPTINIKDGDVVWNGEKAIVVALS